jgi:hypothetical protein
MQHHSLRLAHAALVAAEWLRGIGLVAAGGLSYGLLGGTMPPPGGYDYLVGVTSFATILVGAVDLTLAAWLAARGGVRAQVVASLSLSLVLIATGNPLVPQIAMIAFATLVAVLLGRKTPPTGGNE